MKCSRNYFSQGKQIPAHENKVFVSMLTNVGSGIANSKHATPWHAPRSDVKAPPITCKFEMKRNQGFQVSHLGLDVSLLN